MDQPGKTANPACGQITTPVDLVKKKCLFSCVNTIFIACHVSTAQMFFIGSPNLMVREGNGRSLVFPFRGCRLLHQAPTRINIKITLLQVNNTVQ